MKYICLGYIEPGKFEGMTDDERNAVFDKCFEHNDHLRANGHLVAELALQSPDTALTLDWKNGRVATTDGPYAETKELLGGIFILEARDLNHAVQLVSELPGFKYGLGPIEIRPAADLGEMMKASEQRRRQRQKKAHSQEENNAEKECSHNRHKKLRTACCARSGAPSGGTGCLDSLSEHGPDRTISNGSRRRNHLSPQRRPRRHLPRRLSDRPDAPRLRNRGGRQKRLGMLGGTRMDGHVRSSRILESQTPRRRLRSMMPVSSRSWSRQACPCR